MGLLSVFKDTGRGEIACHYDRDWRRLYFGDAASEGWPALLSPAERERLQQENPWLLDRAVISRAVIVPPDTLKRKQRFPDHRFKWEVYPFPLSALPYVLRSACPQVQAVEINTDARGWASWPGFTVKMNDGRQFSGTLDDGDSVFGTIMFVFPKSVQEQGLLEPIVSALARHVSQHHTAVSAYRDELLKDLDPKRRSQMALPPLYQGPGSDPSESAQQCLIARRWAAQDREALARYAQFEAGWTWKERWFGVRDVGDDAADAHKATKGRLRP